MGCKTCSPKISGVCKVCKLVDGDDSVKIVKFCDVCGVYICDSCSKNWVKRAIAFAKKLTENEG